MEIKVFMKYHIPRIRTKSKGAGKGVKVYVDGFDFDESKTRRSYINDLAASDRHECGMFLCKVEYMELTEDRWWDVESYRDEHLRQYRRQITAIRKEYGLTSDDVRKFMGAR